MDDRCRELGLPSKKIQWNVDCIPITHLVLDIYLCDKQKPLLFLQRSPVAAERVIGLAHVENTDM